MGFSETNRSSDVYPNHTEMRTKPRDFTRPASSQRQDTIEKLQLDPEREFLLGGTWSGDQASTSSSSE